MGCPWPIPLQPRDRYPIQATATESGGAPLGSTPSTSWNLDVLGPVGPIITNILELTCETDLGYAFMNEAECRAFCKSLADETNGNGSPRYPDLGAFDASALVARWSLAKTKTPSAIKTQALAPCRVSLPGSSARDLQHQSGLCSRAHVL